MKRLLIRVDYNSQIASGHLMRCLSIAKCAKEDGFDVTFVMSDDVCRETVTEKGFNLISLKSVWDDLSVEIPLMIDLSRAHRNTILLIDTYSVTPEYTSSLAPYYKIVYLGSKQDAFYGVSTLINYSTNIDRDFYERTYRNKSLLLGPLFTPLRDEFLGIVKERTKQVENVIITTGNTDPDLFCQKLLLHILKSGLSDVNYHVVVGRMFKEKEKLYTLAAKYGNIKLHENETNMSVLFKQSQLAISANGTTVYELCASKVPVISFALVHEQEDSGKSMDALGIVDYCGLFKGHENRCIENVLLKLRRYLTDTEKCDSLVSKASALVDGNGCRRIVEELNKLIEK